MASPSSVAVVDQRFVHHHAGREPLQPWVEHGHFLSSDQPAHETHAASHTLGEGDVELCHLLLAGSLHMDREAHLLGDHEDVRLVRDEVGWIAREHFLANVAEESVEVDRTIPRLPSGLAC